MNNKILFALLILGLTFIFKDELRWIVSKYAFKDKIDDSVSISESQKDNIRVQIETETKGWVIREGFSKNVNNNTVEFYMWDDHWKYGICYVNNIKGKFKSNQKYEFGGAVYKFNVFWDDSKEGYYLKLIKLDDVG